MAATFGCLAVSAAAGTVVNFQINDSPESWAITNATDIDYGSDHGIALMPDGTVKNWGFDYSGSTKVPANLTQMVKVEAGYRHNLCLRSTGTVRAWGANNHGQRNIPAGLQGVMDISAGWDHNLVAKTNGTVQAWGRNDYGQTNVPAGLTGVTKVAGGLSHSLALKSDGTVVAWGRNNRGQTTVPADLTSVVAIDAGDEFSVALKSDGTIVVWGDNSHGQRNVPAGLTGVTKISAGDWTVAAVRSNGSVVGWGDSFFAALSRPAWDATEVATSKSLGRSWFIGKSFRLRIDQDEIKFGGSATGYVDIGDPAPAGGAVVDLVMDGGLPDALDMPATVTVPAGQIRASFPLTHRFALGAKRFGKITASRNGRSSSWALSAEANALAFPATPGAVVGGGMDPVKSQLELAHPATEDLVFDLTSDTDRVSLGATTLTIPAGARTSEYVDIDHFRVGYDGVSAKITATLRGRPDISFPGYVRLNAPSWGYEVPSYTMTPGTEMIVTMRLYQLLREPSVFIFTDTTDAIAVPTSITIPAGQLEATGVIRASRVGTSPLNPTYEGGGGYFPSSIKVVASTVSTIELPAAIPAQTYRKGTVRLNGVAGPGGTVVNLGSSDPALRPATRVTVPEGQSSAQFDVVSSDVAVPTAATITGTAAGVTAQGTITVRPLAIASLTVTASTAQGGGNVEATVTLDETVGVNTLVTIESADPSVVVVPSSTTIVKNTKSRTFTIKTKAVTTTKYVRVTVIKNGTSAYRTLKITP